MRWREFNLYWYSTTPTPPSTPSNEWTWINGSSYPSSGIGQAGVYGTLGTSSAGNVPGGRGATAGWTDSSGNLWIFGGYGLDATGAMGNLDDIWKFSPTSGQWTWVGGSNAVGAAGVYGTEGVAAAQNTPGGRSVQVSWTDASGNMWIFGGSNSSLSGTGGYLNDLWTLSPTTNMWTWMGGSQTPNTVGVYGSLGVPAAGNQPGGRDDSAYWIDANGNLWVFGGYGFVTPNSTTDLADLWEYNPKTKVWTWVGGNNTGGTSGIYGTQGTSAATNQPGARSFGCSWTDMSGNFWMFGGVGWDSKGARSQLNDLWEFSPTTMQWTWISGSNQVNATGSYGTLGAAATSNVPGARFGCKTWKDGSGNLWLFGGKGYAASGVVGDLGDLWSFNPNTGQWTWMGGPNQVNGTGTYGSEGTPASSNTPANRSAATSFVDSSGKFWLFGGYAAQSSNPDQIFLNDLWTYKP
ncbi:MAG TPA: kelch repeat-containing protein [Silvibacterium sp.]|nr:kelch repeat-containing protein [Silvibacterium sp.]